MPDGIIVFRPWICSAGEVPQEGDFLRSKAGSVYLVTLSRPIKGDELRRCVHCVHVGLQATIPNDATVHPFEWQRHGE